MVLQVQGTTSTLVLRRDAKVTQHLSLVIPPAQPGYSNERDQSGGIGVSRKLKPGEEWRPNQPPLDMLTFAATAEQTGVQVELIDLMLERLAGEDALRFLEQRIDGQDGEIWIGRRSPGRWGPLRGLAQARCPRLAIASALQWTDRVHDLAGGE